MTKKILGLILAALIPVAAFGQTNVIQNEAGTSYAPNAGNINSNVAVDRALRLIVSVSSGQPSATNPIKLEDSASAPGDAGIASLIKLQSAITADAAANDYGLIKGDTGGRLITTIAPAGETWYSCTSPITGTGHTQVKAAVASNRIYITHFTCSNTGTVSSNLYIEDDTTPIYVGGVASATIAGIGNWSAVLPVPIRLSVNSALRVAMVTTGTATTCCASGYISTI